MLKSFITNWRRISSKEKIAVVSLLLGWSVFLVGLMGLFWWSKSQGKIEVQAQMIASSGLRSGKLVIEVAGAVKTPGVYIVEANARVADVLSKAGYFSDNADYLYIVRALNQAAELKDGEKIYIPFYGEEAQAQSDELSKAISINTATKEALEELPSIGSKRAEDIISGRPFSSIDELVSKKIVTETMFKEVKNLITI